MAAGKAACVAKRKKLDDTNTFLRALSEMQFEEVPLSYGFGGLDVHDPHELRNRASLGRWTS